MEAALEHRHESPAIYVPRALGNGELLPRERLLAAPLKTLPRPSILDAPITKLRGAGPKLSAAAGEMGISSLGDLLRHLPHGYRDRAEPVRLADLRLGEEATVEVEVAGDAKLRPTRRRRLTILEAEVSDATGKVKAVWFNRAWLADRLVPGTRLLLRGKLEKRGFNVAEHEFLDGEPGHAAGLHTTGIVPVHPATRAAAAAADPRVGLAGDRPWRATRSSRCPAACAGSCAWRGPPTRSRPPTSRPTSTPRRPPGSGSPSRSCSSTRRRSSRAAAGDVVGRTGGIAARRRGGGGRALARVAAVRADRRPAPRHRRDRRRPRLRRSRCSGC